MTQPAKVQEPSMEEILASIRRIIADDEAKPAVEKPAVEAAPAKADRPEKPAQPAPPAKPPVTAEVQPLAPRAPQPVAAKPAPPIKPPVAAAPPPPPAVDVSNSQNDIDALLNGLDEATGAEEIRRPLPDGEVFDLTDEMAVRMPEPVKASFQTVEPQDDLEFAENVAASASHRQPAFEPPPLVNSSPPPQILSRSTISAVESAFNTLAHTVLSNNARTLEDLVKEMLRPMLKSWLDDNLP